MVDYALATLKTASGHGAALRVAGRYWPLADCAARLGRTAPDSVAALLDGWQEHAGTVEAVAAAAADGGLDAALGSDAASAALAAPIRFPRKLIAIGANYGDHVAAVMPLLDRLGYQRPEGPPDRPPYFMKPPTTAIVDPDGDTHIPEGCTQYDWEIELAAVIGRRIGNASEAEALDAVFGYTVSIDYSARDFQVVPKTLFRFDLFSGKAFDASCPLGPVIVPAAFMGDPQDARMVLTVNGTVRQDASTAGMIYPLGAVISHLSKVVTLEPGDVILTETPAGTGIESGIFLKPGDTVAATIEPIGTLVSHVR